MGRRISRRVLENSELRIRDLQNVSFVDLKVKLPDGIVGQLISSNGKIVKVLINNKIEEIEVTEQFNDWIVLT